MIRLKSSLPAVVALLHLAAVAAVDIEKSTMVSHIWEVGLDNMKNVRAGNLIESPKFVSYNGSRTETWYLRVYPKGYGASHGFVSVYLVYISDPPIETTPKVEIFIDNNEEIDVLRKWSPNTYSQIEESSGWDKFVSPDVLLNPNNGFIFDGKIRFGARIASDRQIMDESENAEITYIWGIGAQTMELTAEIFVESPKFHTFRLSETGNIVEESWTIRIYPQGTVVQNDTSDPQLAMYLVYDGDAPITPTVGYLILNSNPENIIRYWSTKTYAKNRDSRGYNDMISKKRILDPSQGFVDRDGLILFAVRVPTSYASPKIETAVTVLNIWEVGVDTIRSLANGVSTESPKYTIMNGTHEEEWFLRLYPNGFLDENAGIMSMYMVCSKGAPTRAMAEVLILNDKDELTLRKWFKEPYDEDGESNGFHRAALPGMLLDPSKGFIYDGDKIRFGIRMHTTPPAQKPSKQKYETFIWEVSVRTLQNGGQHESPKYMAKGPYGKEAWHLRLFPQGYTAENKGYISLYLVYGGKFKSTPKAEVFIVNQREEQTIRKWSTSTYENFGQSIGFSRLISTEHLLNLDKGFINNNRVQFGLRIPIEGDRKDVGEECPVCNYRCPACNPQPALQPTSPPVVISPPKSTSVVAVTQVTTNTNPVPATCPPTSNPGNQEASSPSGLIRGVSESNKLVVWKNVRIKVDGAEIIIEEIKATSAINNLFNQLSQTKCDSGKPILEILQNIQKFDAS